MKKSEAIDNIVSAQKDLAKSIGAGTRSIENFQNWLDDIDRNIAEINSLSRRFDFDDSTTVDEIRRNYQETKDYFTAEIQRLQSAGTTADAEPAAPTNPQTRPRPSAPPPDLPKLDTPEGAIAHMKSTIQSAKNRIEQSQDPERLVQQTEAKILRINEGISNQQADLKYMGQYRLIQNDLKELKSLAARYADEQSMNVQNNNAPPPPMMDNEVAPPPHLREPRNAINLMKQIISDLRGNLRNPMGGNPAQMIAHAKQRIEKLHSLVQNIASMPDFEDQFKQINQSLTDITHEATTPTQNQGAGALPVQIEPVGSAEPTTADPSNELIEEIKEAATKAGNTSQDIEGGKGITITGEGNQELKITPTATGVKFEGSHELGANTLESWADTRGCHPEDIKITIPGMDQIQPDSPKGDQALEAFKSYTEKGFHVKNFPLQDYENKMDQKEFAQLKFKYEEIQEKAELNAQGNLSATA